MLTFLTFITESAAKSGYSDEHAFAHVWNHMVKHKLTHDKDAMNAELEKAKKDKTHPLHHSKIPSAGFKGGKKTAASIEDYHRELSDAVNTVHAIAKHPDFKKAVKEGHQAKVMGASRGEVSPLWKKHGATKGAVSKSDVSISKPGSEEGSGLKLSLKKGGGSQLMSGGPEENKAVHDHAAREMLDTHPDYAKKSKKAKDAIHNDIMSKMDEVTHHLNAMKTASPEKQQEHKNKAQAVLNAVHDAHPHLNSFVRKEATTGRGKFGENSPHAASYLVKSASGNKTASIQHVNEVDHRGPRLRASLPKKTGRSGNIKADERS
jgi:hypothetical protein